MSITTDQVRLIIRFTFSFYFRVLAEYPVPTCGQEKMEAEKENGESRAEHKVDPASRKIQERISQGRKKYHPDAGGESGKMPMPGNRKVVGYGADPSVNGHMRLPCRPGSSDVSS